MINEFDMLNYIPDNVTLIYRQSSLADNLIDVITANNAKKEYQITNSILKSELKGYDEYGITNDCILVSHNLFDIFLDGFKNNNFKKVDL